MDGRTGGRWGREDGATQLRMTSHHPSGTLMMLLVRMLLLLMMVMLVLLVRMGRRVWMLLMLHRVRMVRMMSSWASWMMSYPWSGMSIPIRDSVRGAIRRVGSWWSSCG